MNDLLYSGTKGPTELHKLILFCFYRPVAHAFLGSKVCSLSSVDHLIHHPLFALARLPLTTLETADGL